MAEERDEGERSRCWVEEEVLVRLDCVVMGNVIKCWVRWK